MDREKFQNPELKYRMKTMIRLEAGRSETGYME